MNDTISQDNLSSSIDTLQEKREKIDIALEEYKRESIEKINSNRNEITSYEQKITVLRRAIADMESDLKIRGLFPRITSVLSTESTPLKRKGKGKGSGGMIGNKPCWEYCLEVLRESQTPLHVSDIEKRIYDRYPELSYKGNTSFKVGCQKLLDDKLVKWISPHTFQAVSSPDSPESMEQKITSIFEDGDHPWSIEVLKREISLSYSEEVTAEQIQIEIDKLISIGAIIKNGNYYERKPRELF